MHSSIVFVDYEVVNTYGARMYSRINVACPSCDVILLCDQAHRKFIKEAMELGAYASILAPYEEWEVLTIIMNILTGKKKTPKEVSLTSPNMTGSFRASPQHSGMPARPRKSVEGSRLQVGRGDVC